MATQAEEAKAAYIERLNAIIAADEVVGELFAERAALQEGGGDRTRIMEITNIIANCARPEVQAALKAIKRVL